MNSIIPKVVHMSWSYREELHQEQSPIVLNGIKNIITLNPDWQVYVHNDVDIDNYLKDNLTYNNYKLIENVHIVEKCDTWRLLKLYNEGGMYIDIDRFYNISMNDILDENITCVLPMCLDRDFSQDIMISAPYNPIYNHTLNLVFQRRRSGANNTYYLGPQTYMHGITEVLCGEQINTNPGEEKINFIRQKIKDCKSIKTYRENPPYDTVVYKHDEHIFDYGNSKCNTHEEMKREFYGRYNIKHWTNEW